MLFCLILISLGNSAFAQRYCVIDSHYILEQMPEYQTAQHSLDSISGVWQKEVDAKFQAVDQLYKQYQAEQVMLSDKLKKVRQDEIMQKENEAHDLQQKLFGYQGELFKRREELVKPLQDKIYSAVQKLASQDLYDFVLDKSAGITVFYADPKIDKTQDVLNILGIKK